MMVTFIVIMKENLNLTKNLTEGLKILAVLAAIVLVLWTMNPLDLGKGIQVLTDPAVKRIAIANPNLAPYGREALNALQHFKMSVTSRLVCN